MNIDNMSLWGYGVNPAMSRLHKDGLMEAAKEEVLREAEATLKRVHGEKPAPRIDYYHALEFAAEDWLKRRNITL